MCLKGLVTAAFGSSEPFFLLKVNGHVSAIPTSESTDSLIYITAKSGWLF